MELWLLRGSETSRKKCVWTTLAGHNGVNNQLTWGILSLNGLEVV